MMEFLLVFSLIYGIGAAIWVIFYLIKYIDGWDKADRQDAAKRLLQSPIWPISAFGIFLRFIKELKAVAKGEEE